MGSTPSRPSGSRGSRRSTLRSRGRSAGPRQSTSTTGEGSEGFSPEQRAALRHGLSEATVVEDGMECVDLDRLVAWVDRSTTDLATEFAAAVLRLALQRATRRSSQGREVVPYERAEAAVFALSTGASDAAKGRLLYDAMRGGSPGGVAINRAALGQFLQHVTPWQTPAAIATVVRAAIPEPDGGLSDRHIVEHIGRLCVVPRLSVDVV